MLFWWGWVRTVSEGCWVSSQAGKICNSIQPDRGDAVAFLKSKVCNYSIWEHFGGVIGCNLSRKSYCHHSFDSTVICVIMDASLFHVEQTPLRFVLGCTFNIALVSSCSCLFDYINELQSTIDGTPGPVPKGEISGGAQITLIFYEQFPQTLKLVGSGLFVSFRSGTFDNLWADSTLTWTCEIQPESQHYTRLRRRHGIAF